MKRPAQPPKRRNLKRPAPIAWTGTEFPPGTITRAHVTVQEFALKASVSARKAWELIAADRVNAVRWGARTTRISVAEVERFLAAGGWQ